ncbi:4643_t:CDS:2, partial [Dentiscutata heterogama]
QRVFANSTFCKLSNDGMVVNISIIDSTFNENGTNYYVKIDNNFAKTRTYNEPLRGIESEVWFLESVYRASSSDTDATGLAVLTIDASNNFSIIDQSKYIDALLDEIADKVPVRRERLSSDKKFQPFDEFGQIAISIRIDLPNNTENTVPGVFSNLNKMILYKNITTFCTGMTNDLNSTFGFRPVVSGDDSYGKVMISNVTPPINSSVDSSTTDIRIKFSSPVYLSTGNITIHKASDDSIRQIVFANNSEFCTISYDGTVVSISIINSTFNEYGEKYYVKIGNNFAKSRIYNNELLIGIESGIWLLTRKSESRVNHSDEIVTGFIQLTP